MSDVIYEWLPAIGRIPAVFFLGLVIKSMDDFLDEPWPPTKGILSRFAKGLLPYSLVLFGLALYLDFRLVWSLFLAGYAVGMFSHPYVMLPSGLPSWIETLVAGIVSWLTVGYSYTLWAMLCMVSVQLLDDFLDYHVDSRRSEANWLHKLGKGEGVILLLLTFYLAVSLKPFSSVLVIVCSLLIGEGVWSLAKRGEKG